MTRPLGKSPGEPFRVVDAVTFLAPDCVTKDAPASKAGDNPVGPRLPQVAGNRRPVAWCDPAPSVCPVGQQKQGRRRHSDALPTDSSAPIRPRALFSGHPSRTIM